MTSGYTSNTTMTVNGDTLKKVMESTAQLIRVLRQDHVPPGGGEKLAWVPTVITLPTKGMIYPEPMKNNSPAIKDEPNPDDWQWAVVKAVPIPKEEQNKFPDPKNPGNFYKFKMDTKTRTYYDKLCFMDAAEELGLFQMGGPLKAPNKEKINENNKDKTK